MAIATIHNFLNLFTSEVTIHEDAKNVKSTIIGDGLKMPSTDDFSNALIFLNPRDNLRISVIIGDNEPIDYYSTQNDVDGFINDCNNLLSINHVNNTFQLEIVVAKNIEKQRLSVYSLDAFFKNLNELKPQGLFFVLKEAISNNRGIIFESQYEEILLKTTIICFCTRNYEVNFIEPKISRVERINMVKSISHYNLLTSYNFIPEDFYIQESSATQFSEIFNRLLCFISTAFLFDIVTIDDFDVDYKLNGYKAISCRTQFAKISIKHAIEYFKIYDWCFNGGNLSDKIGLARNIISLHLANAENLSFSGNPFSSIQSSYKVYEKQNIKQYIEIRNKISDQLLDFKNKADKIIESFAGDFKKSLFAFITFFSSIIVIQVLRNGNFTNTFTTDATILAFAFLFICFCFFLASRWELNKQKERFTQSYQNLKLRYRDLLNDEDIQRILNNDKDYNDDILFIEGKKKVYSILWVTAIVTFFIAIFLLYLINSIVRIINIFN